MVEFMRECKWGAINHTMITAAAVTAASMSEDGRWLVSTDGDVRLWDLRIDKLLECARRVAGRELTEKERAQYKMDALAP